MFEALIVTLREGVEAALVVGVIAAYLRREAGGRYLGALWAGIAAAVAASLAGGLALRRLAINEDAFEGVLYLVAAGVVGSVVVWMWRHSRELAGEMKGSLARILDRPGAARSSIRFGIFLFTFLMVFREGMETVLFLSALSLSSGGLATLLGVFIGLAAAVVFGVLFVRGTLRIDLGRFFKITGIALLIFVAQLLIDGYHELAESGWLPANRLSMATIGPLAKNEIFFIVAVLALPILMLLVPGRRGAAHGAAVGAAWAAGLEDGGDARLVAARLERATARRQAQARVLAGALGLAILAALSLGFVYSRPPAALSPATVLAPGADGAVRIAVAGFQPETLRRFAVTVDGVAVRFIAVPIGDLSRPDSTIAVAFDACQICGSQGYYQEGANIACLHCGSTIYPPSIGQSGGCNPIPLAARREAGDLVIRVADLRAGAAAFGSGAAAGHHHMGM